MKSWAPAMDGVLSGWPSVRSLTARGLSGGGAGNLRCSPGAEERHRRGVRWSQLAALPHPLHGQSAHPSCPSVAQPGVATMVRIHLPATVSRRWSTANLDRVVEQLREPFAQVAELLADAAPDLAGLHGLPSGPLARSCGPNNPQERPEPGDKFAGLTWWASSPTGCRRGAWWARCWPSNTTNGPKPAATSPSPTPPATRHCRRPICWTQRP